MKKIFTLIVACMALALPMTAQESDGNSKPKPVVLSTHADNSDPNPTIHRAPMRVCVEAWYDILSETITIIYDGDASGEVLLYRDGALLETSSDINTTFAVSESGFYTIEIITEGWTAIGNLEI